MPASFSAFARAADICPIEAQRLRLVCSATSFAPSTMFWKSRFDRPWPCVTMQNRCAPAASAARACSRIWSGDIIACMGVSASAYFDCAQKPQSSAQPPDLALTSEHRSVESPKCSRRACHARSTSASMSAWAVRRPSAWASSRLMSGGTRQKLRRVPDATVGPMNGREFADEVARALGVEPISDGDANLLLGTAGVAAHASERLAAPLTTYLAGLSGRPLHEVRAAVQAIADR